MESFNTGPDEYLGKIVAAVDAVDIPVIGSLNGVSPGGWTRYAARIEEAGASALELNIYLIPTDPADSATLVEGRYLSVIQDVAKQVSIPIAVKLSPFFTATSHFCQSATYAGAKGLVLFNRFYQPDIDLEALSVVPSLQLSSSAELRLPLRWIAILYGRIEADLALTTGVHTHEDVLKGLMAGANVTMMASELMANGIQRLSEIRNDLVKWMEEHEYESVDQMRGSMSQINIGDETAFERANYMKVLQSWRPDPTGALY
jgi:dihydroorotate dehydrogenase (fumarate)